MGTVALKIFIVPGKILNIDVLEECDIDDSHITTSPIFFMNYTLFFKLVGLFAVYVPDSVERLIVLVYDGYHSHYNDKILAKAKEHKYILIMFPANASHLIYSLDIAVFKPFKLVLNFFFRIS